ncbi:MAG: hypothetical protein JW794_04195 [Candidatus Cloacimonetes bacterium]|nr:hypothetical protein [Candidatus Cloacimonadota bacterium]
MNTQTYRHRFSVILNYLGIILMLIIFYLVKLQVLKAAFLLLEILPLFIIIFSFRNAFIKTGIWKMTHAPGKQLDEREMQVILHATNISYSLFAIVVLIVIYLFLLCGFGQIDAVLAISILYIAHILPASILLWNERNHSRDKE